MGEVGVVARLCLWLLLYEKLAKLILTHKDQDTVTWWMEIVHVGAHFLHLNYLIRRS